VGKFRKVLSIGISFKLLLAFSSLSCFSQIITTRAPDSIGMTDNYDFYIFWLNNEGRISLAMAFANDTIHICPFIVHTPNNLLFKAVTSHELVHYYNYVSHGEIKKTDSLRQDVQRSSHIDSGYLETPPELKKIVYKGSDGSSVNKAIIIKKATTLIEGIVAEYAYLEKEFGQRGIYWKPLGQYLHPDNSNRYYDIIKVNIIKTNETKYFWFDITGFWGKSYIYFPDREIK
jgi:hypothetical protein